MSIDLVRMRFAAVAARIETTGGVDAIGGTPTNADWLAADCERPIFSAARPRLPSCRIATRVRRASISRFGKDIASVFPMG